MSTATSSALFLGAYLSILILSLLIFRILFHPLAGIPGPWIASLSNFWLAYHVRNGNARQLGKAVHKTYGPIVRVSPNEIWCNSAEAFKAIYSPGSGCEKSDFYLSTALPKPRLDWLLRPLYADTLDLLSERNTERYRLQRRLIGPVYRASNIILHEKKVDDVLKKTISTLDRLGGEEVDLKQWMHIIAVECLGALVLSWSPGLLEKQTDRGTGAQAYLGWRRKSIFGLFPTMVKLELCSSSLGRLFSWAWGITYRVPLGFRPFFPDVGRRVTRRIALALRPNPPKDERRDLMADLIRLHQERPQFSENYLKRMAITNFGAGHETMTSTLTSVIAMVGSHPDVQKKIADEVRRHESPTPYHDASALDLTQAAIKEASRLHPVIGMSLSRTIPKSGLRIHGYYLPPGTNVGCNPVALHCNDQISGPEPEIFDPSRWSDASRSRVLEQHSLSWGGGSRTCPGRNLAELIVFKTVPTLLQHFDIEIEIPPEDQMPSYFMSMMTGVRARFVRKQEG